MNKPIEKIALVIGVANYQYATPLRNPINDENDMADSLEKLGFIVYKFDNPDLRTFSNAIDSFGTRIKTADVCLFYYSGHGMEYNGENFIFPTDSRLLAPSDLYYEAYPLNKLLGKIDFAKVRTSVVLLDACRDNPFARNWNGKNYVSKGLASISQSPNGTFIGFAASPGQTAADGVRRNGTYTEAILKFIEEKNLSIDVMFNRVNKDVRAQTNNRQVPYKNSSLDEEFYFQKIGAEINNFTQEEFDKRVDTLVEAKLKEREAVNRSQNIPNSINKLFNPNESVVGSALSNLLIENPKDFSGEEVVSISKAYAKYIDKQIRVTGQNDADFFTLLDSIAQQKHFTDMEIKSILNYYDVEGKNSELDPILLKIIDSSKADFVTNYFKDKIEQNDANSLGEMYFGRFLRVEYLQPVAFYLNYLDRMDKTSSQLKSTFDSFINFFYSINIYKSNVIDLLNNRKIVDSIFVYGQIYYEQNFINYRKWLKNQLSNWIDETTLNKTYFFSTLCPCSLDVSINGRGERQFPCK